MKEIKNTYNQKPIFGAQLSTVVGVQNNTKLGVDKFKSIFFSLCQNVKINQKTAHIYCLKFQHDEKNVDLNLPLL